MIMSCMFILILVCTYGANQIPLATGCSSRAVPKPRTSSSSVAGAPSHSSTTAAPKTTSTTTTTPRPNITFPTYKCPETFDAWYCLNDATCFAVKIGELPVYSCECATGFMGQRCEYKEIDGSYLPKRPRPMLEKASIASGATCALLFMLFICLTLYLRYDQKSKSFEYQDHDDEDVGLTKCQYCNDRRCCGESSDFLGINVDKYRYKQSLERLQFTFAIKRSTKF